MISRIGETLRRLVRNLRSPFHPRGTRMTTTSLPIPTEAATAVEATSTVPAAPAPPAACTNCGVMRTGEFCAACGQQAVRGRLTVPGIARQVAHDVLNVDRGLLFTALELTRRPGDAIRDYVDGRRVRYTGPVKYFILTVALTTFATTQLGVLNEMATGFVEQMGEAPPVTVDQTSRFLSQWMTLFMALGVPFTAGVTWRLFRRARLTYAEHLALNLYSYGHQSLGLALVLLVALAVPAWETGLVTGWTAAAALYFGWTCARLFRQRALRAVPLAVLAMALGTVIYLLVASFVIGVGVGVRQALAAG